MPNVPEHLLEKIGLNDLKKDLRSRNLSTKGSKADLICRLSTDELWAASRKGDLKRVIHLVQECGAAIDYDPAALSGSKHRWQGLTPLHLAARNGHTDVVKFLVEQGAQPEREGAGHVTPLHLAAMNGRLKAVRFLASQEIPVDPVDSSGRTPIYLAVENGKLDTVRFLYAKGASLECRKVQNSRERTLIHLAAMHGFTALVKFIAGRGHNLDCVDANSRSPLHLAAKGGHFDTVKFLAEQHIFINRTDYKQLTALQLAARAGHAEVVGTLIVNNADPGMRTASSRLTALHLAAMNGHTEVLRMLLNFGVDINCRDTDFKTALHMAASKGHVEATKFLLGHGASVDCTTRSFNTTPLHLAVSNGHLPTVEALHDHGAVLTAKANFGRTPLHMAAKRGELEMVKLLLEKGVRINETDEAGTCALHEACTEGHAEVVALLLSYHASPEIEASKSGLPGEMFKKNISESSRNRIRELLVQARRTTNQSEESFDEDKLNPPILISNVRRARTHVKLDCNEEDVDRAQQHRLFMISPKAIKLPDISFTRGDRELKASPSQKLSPGRLERASEPELRTAKSFRQEGMKRASENHVAPSGSWKLPHCCPIERQQPQEAWEKPVADLRADSPDSYSSDFADGLPQNVAPSFSIGS